MSKNFEARAWGLVIAQRGAHVHLWGNIAPMSAEQAREVAADLVRAADAADAHRKEANE
jgi:hypothetical protein